ncbi:SDR family oxidoreductase [Streptomyces sp. NPDC049597]|uniref:SDR family oxidoreductase n=1 Tax=Streptomyces sp. NPDC049597 TaxID=3155276 RepID=UPI003427B698
MGRRTALVTNVLEYGGPGTVEALEKAGYKIACHDRTFTDPRAREAYAAAHTDIAVLSAQDPQAVVAEAIESLTAIDALISNDVHPNRPAPIEDVSLDDLRATLEAVLVTPFRLAQAIIPHLKGRGTGSIVLVTSARELQPEPGFSVPTTARGGATTFALALARELAPSGIQVNAIAPNYLYSELYYPRDRFIDNPVGRKEIEDRVPVGRLGTPEELGNLVEFFASGKSAFVTGQVIAFTGGWP